MSRDLSSWRKDVSEGLSALRREMDNVIENYFGQGEKGFSSSLSPRVNIAETENEFEVTVELPGIRPEDVLVEMQNGQLSIRGETREEKEDSGKQYHRVERLTGRFQRSFPIPGEIDEEKTSASFHDGVLKIVIPKAAGSKPRKIPVSGQPPM